MRGIISKFEEATAGWTASCTLMLRVRRHLRLIMSYTRPGVPDTMCTPCSSLRMSSPVVHDMTQLPHPDKIAAGATYRCSCLRCKSVPGCSCSLRWPGPLSPSEWPTLAWETAPMLALCDTPPAGISRSVDDSRPNTILTPASWCPASGIWRERSTSSFPFLTGPVQSRPSLA
jgi:hypothetical protein